MQTTPTAASASNEAREGAIADRSPVPSFSPPVGPGLLVARHISLDLADIWSLTASATSASRYFVWRDPARRQALVAWGEVARCSDPREHTYSAVQRWCSSFIERWLPGDAPPVDVPFAVGGFSFAEGGPGPTGGEGSADDAWQGWPATCWFIPKYVAYQWDDGRSGLVVRGPAAFDPDPCTHPGAGCSVAQAAALPWRSAPERSGYRELVLAALNDIAGGRLAKVVAARRARSLAPPGSRFDAAATLAALRGDAITFGLRLGGSHAWLGATPELLAAVRGRRLTTAALAGTSDPLRDPDGEQLRHSAKDLHEHALVADGICEALLPVCSDIERGAPRVVAAGTVQHLMTPIEGRLLGEAGLLDVAARLHPTAALCGSPRRAAARWIAEHEPASRGWYGSPVGWLTRDGNGVLAVAIRSVLLGAAEALAFTGAGIVAGSDPAAEWRETEAKLRTVSAALRVAQCDLDQGDLDQGDLEEGSA